MTTATRDKEGAGGARSACDGKQRRRAARSVAVHWHQQIGHLAFVTIKRMARDPASGIRLSSKKRMACVSCLEVKQTRNMQSKQESGVHSPIDCIGGVICWDLKGPMTPQDRLGNR
uniref:GAG-pre-integrase domain-containing protein n=1 Tax=Peronospora matthiolae TaxID=2874970 RepID=A0AAV1VLY8_9STRA